MYSHFLKSILSVSFLLTCNYTYAYNSTSKARICHSCQTTVDFSNSAKAGVGPHTGVFTFIVANPSTNIVYDVTIDATYERELRRYMYVALSSHRAPELEASFAYFYPFFTKSQQIAAQAPSGIGADSGLGGFLSSDQGAVCTAFSGTPGFVGLAQQLNSNTGSLLFGVLRQFFGFGPTGIYVFGNGDVATYAIYPDLPGVTACKYEPGSARNPEGIFINDLGHGGHGTSDYNNYVRPGSNDTYFIGAGSSTLSCAFLRREDGSLIGLGCTRTP